MEANLLYTAEELLLSIVEPVLVILMCSLERKARFAVSFPIVADTEARTLITVNYRGTQGCREGPFEVEKMRCTFRGRENNP